MALRLLKIIAPATEKDSINERLTDRSVDGAISHYLTEQLWTLEVVLPAEQTEAVLDDLEQHFKQTPDFRVLLLPVEATVPRAPEPSETPEGAPADHEPSHGQASDAEKNSGRKRISREELYMDIQDISELSRYFVLMLILSAVVAGIGLLRNNTAVVIGAMIIAPLLGPSVALALGTTLGDITMIRRGAKTNAVGIAIVLVISAAWGYFQTVDPTAPEIASRTVVGYSDVVLASASGIAGVLSITLGTASTLVGVMIAVALLPPLVAGGLLLGSGHPVPAIGALLVFTTNFICVNLTGVLTFLFQGIQPLSWWEKTKARTATRRAILIWCLTLALLILAIWLNT